jgi:hemolysin III
MKPYPAAIPDREEWLNTITHALGLLFGLISVPLLLLKAFDKNSGSLIAAATIYGVSLLMVFCFSTIFHSCREGKRRQLFKTLDHISIYYLIAGTYTPFIQVFVQNEFGERLLYALWGLTAIGTIFKLFFTGKYEILSTLVYLAMGWMLLTGINDFFGNMPGLVTNLIILGGILYSIGVFFYVREWFRYHHAVWHVLVVAAAACHFMAIFEAVQQFPAAG